MSSALKVARVLVYTCRECDRRLGIKRCQTGHLEKVLTFEGPREASSFGITPCKPKFLVGRVDGCFFHADLQDSMQSVVVKKCQPPSRLKTLVSLESHMTEKELF